MKNSPKDKIIRNTNMPGVHIPIMLKESLDFLQINSSDVLLDCTLNRAGHSQEFAKYLGKSGILIGNDLDSVAIKEAKVNLDKCNKESAPRYIFINDNFKNIKENFLKLKSQNILDDQIFIDKVFVDLGLSSQELDISNRGFSFNKNEPLLMTFKDESSITEDDTTAKYIVNNWSEELLADIIYNFSDEKYARRIARNIVSERENLRKEDKSIETTFDLVKIIENSVPNFYKHGRTHFATKTFQAIRMAVNDEVGSIIQLISDLPEILNHKSRIVFLTFHSTEDRIVKKYFKSNADFIPINKKVITPDVEELSKNPRSRSCKLRCYEYNKID